MLSTLASLLLGAIGQMLADLVAQWRRDRALQDLGASRAESANQKATIDAVQTRKRIEDDVASLSDDDVVAELRRWRKS